MINKYKVVNFNGKNTTILTEVEFGYSNVVIRYYTNDNSAMITFQGGIVENGEAEIYDERVFDVALTFRDDKAITIMEEMLADIKKVFKENNVPCNQQH